MSKESEELRQQIAQTRRELSHDVDAIADKVSPSRVVHRQGEKIKSSIHRAKEAVMGANETASDHTRKAADNVGEQARQAPQQVLAQTRGNPLAAGLIAFGAGLLVSSLLPSSEREAEMVDKLKTSAGPLAEELQDSAKQVVQHMKQPVLSAAEELKTSAGDSVAHVKQEASGQMDDLQNQAKDTAKDLSGDS